MLFIDESGQEYEVDPKDEGSARKDGLTRAFAFVSPEGEEVIVKEGDINKATQKGFEMLQKDADEIGMGEAALRGLGSSLSFGFSDEIVGGLKAGKEKLFGDSEESFGDLYKRERDLERMRNESAFEQQTGAYGTGFAGGLLTNPASLVGKLGLKAGSKLAGLTASKAAPSIGQIAGRGAIEGTIAGVGGGAGLGQAEKIEDIGKEASLGGLAGGVLGGAVGSIAKGIKKIGGNLAEEGLENVQKKSIGYHTARPQKILQKAGIEPEDLIKNLDERGVYEGVKSTDDVVSNLNRLAKKDSEKIGETIGEIDEVAKTVDNPNAFLDAVIGYRQKVVNTLTDPKKTAAADIKKARRLAKEFTEGIDDKFLGGNTPEKLMELGKKDPKKVNALLKNLQNQGFQDLYREKSAISRSIRELRGKSDVVQAEKAQDLQRVLMDTLDEYVQKNVPKERASELLSKLSQDRKDMLFSRTAQQIAKDTAKREGKNRMFGLTDIIIGTSLGAAANEELGPLGYPLGIAAGVGFGRLSRRGTGALINPLRKTTESISKGSIEREAGRLTSAGARLPKPTTTKEEEEK